MAYDDVCLKRHILLLGWTEKGREIVDNLHSPDVVDPRQIVIVTDRPVVLDPSKEECRGVVVVPGDASDKNVLRMANAERASGAIILAEPGATGVTRSLMCVLAVRSISSEIYIVAEVSEEADKCHFEALGGIVDEVVCPGEYVSKILAQGAMFPGSGVVDFYTHLLGQTPESNEIYLVEVPPQAVGMTYPEAYPVIVAAADQGVSPIGFITLIAGGAYEVVISPGAHGSEDLSHVLVGSDRIVLISQTRPVFEGV